MTRGDRWVNGYRGGERIFSSTRRSTSNPWRIPPSVTARGYVLFEDVIYEDMVAYFVSRIDVIENDSDFFVDGEINPEDGKRRKLQSSCRSTGMRPDPLLSPGDKTKR